MIPVSQNAVGSYIKQDVTDFIRIYAIYVLLVTLVLSSC